MRQNIIIGEIHSTRMLMYFIEKEYENGNWVDVEI